MRPAAVYPSCGAKRAPIQPRIVRLPHTGSVLTPRTTASDPAHGDKCRAPPHTSPSDWIRRAAGRVQTAPRTIYTFPHHRAKGLFGARYSRYVRTWCVRSANAAADRTQTATRPALPQAHGNASRTVSPRSTGAYHKNASSTWANAGMRDSRTRAPGLRPADSQAGRGLSRFQSGYAARAAVWGSLTKAPV